ncbi:transient receptor potential channel pyrexia-like isoform X2 [Gigantopelta aegis]|uniref:transient receptor potential channel pyrexia-like isoform X2 n=1 Tax=Gigantopelta aegis TaxID=1735272 RepID=UPI001B88E734|nr:transient receptor potential channel pyrexia-like isoform X2 [Gigantopelta aegis]
MDLHHDLYFAVDCDDPGKLEALITSGVNVNAIFEDDMNISTQTILHFCCVKGRTQCARILVEAGANLYARDNWGLTPLIHAVGANCTEIVELLLANDPGLVDIQDNYGKSALHCAVSNQFEDCIRILLKYDAYVNIQNDDGVTPTSTCCLVKDEDYDPCNILRMLIEAGADVNMKDGRSKRTPLQSACLTKKTDAVELLLATGADPNTLDAAGRTPLTNLIYECIRSYHSTHFIDSDVSAIMIMLIQGGSDINMMTSPESNPLIAAVSVKAAPLVSFFLENGAEPDVKYYILEKK